MKKKREYTLIYPKCLRRLRIKSGDVLVIQFPQKLSLENMRVIEAQVKEIGKQQGVDNLGAIILEDGARISAILSAGVEIKVAEPSEGT